jgi:hypothetical protein
LVNTEDLLLAVSETVPLSQTMSERIDTLREWAQNRARSANSVRNIQPRGRIKNTPQFIVEEDEEL